MTYQPNLAPTVESIKREIREWRAVNKAPKPFPAVIWEQAVQLAKADGIGPVARALRLDYGCLKKRVAGIEKATQSKLSPTGPVFFEFLQPSGLAIESCVLLLETPRGSKVRMEFGAAAPSALASFIRDLGL